MNCNFTEIEPALTAVGIDAKTLGMFVSILCSVALVALKTYKTCTKQIETDLTGDVKEKEE